jgi:UDP-3-O-[3-hydroxymyristoyl] glucosamine N-acyltransferase
MLSSLASLFCFGSAIDYPILDILFFSQLLNAMIGNHVEIGANTCIDRGR